MSIGLRQGRGPCRRRHLCRRCLSLVHLPPPLSRCSTIHFPTPLLLFRLPLLLLPTHPSTTLTFHTTRTLTTHTPTPTHTHTHTRITTTSSIITCSNITHTHNNTSTRSILTRLTRSPLPLPHLAQPPPWINHLHNCRRSPDRPRRLSSLLNSTTQR